MKKTLMIAAVVVMQAMSPVVLAGDPYAIVEDLRPIVERIGEIEQQKQQKKEQQQKQQQKEQRQQQKQQKQMVQQFREEQREKRAEQKQERVRQAEETREARRQERQEKREAARERDRAQLEENVSHCIKAHHRGYGGFDNTCPFPVRYGYCVRNPKADSWTSGRNFDCAYQTSGNGGTGGMIEANGSDGNHTGGGDRVYWFACRDGASPQYHWTGSGLSGRCVPF